MGIKASEQQAQQEAVIETYDFLVAGTHYRYTSYYQSQVIGGVSYPAETLERGGDQAIDDSLAGRSCDITLPASNAFATALKTIKDMRLTSVTVAKYFSDDLTESEAVFSGDLKEVRFEGGFCKMKFDSVSMALDTDIPKVIVQSACNHTLFDAVCGLNSDLYKDVVTPTVSGKTLTSATFGGHADGYYKGGRVYYPARDEYRFITAHSGNVITLHYVFSGLTTGETVHAWPGCDKKPETCDSVFSNIAQFVGFPYTPRKDARNAVTNE